MAPGGSGSLQQGQRWRHTASGQLARTLLPGRVMFWINNRMGMLQSISQQKVPSPTSPLSYAPAASARAAFLVIGNCREKLNSEAYTLLTLSTIFCALAHLQAWERLAFNSKWSSCGWEGEQVCTLNVWGS